MGTLDESEQSWYSADTDMHGPKIHAEHYRVVSGAKIDVADEAAVLAAWESASRVGDGSKKSIYNLEGWLDEKKLNENLEVKAETPTPAFPSSVLACHEDEEIKEMEDKSSG